MREMRDLFDTPTTCLLVDQHSSAKMTSIFWTASNRGYDSGLFALAGFRGNIGEDKELATRTRPTRRFNCRHQLSFGPIQAGIACKCIGLEDPTEMGQMLFRMRTEAIGRDPKRPIEATLLSTMSTPHLGDSPHPLVASAARELLNKSENERTELA